MRLIKTNVKKFEHLWSLSMYMRALKKKELMLKKLVKVQHIMNAYKSETIFYSKLFIITKKEWMKQKHTDMRYTSVEKKNSIINHIVTKSHVKAHKDMKNITKRSSDEKRKHIFTQWKRSHIIDLTINIELIVKSTNSQKNMLNKKSVNTQENT